MLTVAELAETSDMPELAFDPYLRHVEMAYTGAFYPLGFPLKLRTNSKAVLAAAEESWGSFKQHFDTPVLQVNFGVLEGDSTGCPAGPVFRGHRNIIAGIADSGNFCINDVVNGYSFAWLTSAAVVRRSYLRYHYLEAAALAHISNRYTAPIHAACVELNGRGILLCGDSGSGKSSLSFACARAGWTYITDDASFLLHTPNARRVVGNCHFMRLRPSAGELFAEVAGKPLTPRAGGKPSIELFMATLPGITQAASSAVDRVVFLNRREAKVQELIPFPREAARRYIHQRLSGVEELRQLQVESVDGLLAVETLELRYRDLDWAVDRLERLVRGKE